MKSGQVGQLFKRDPKTVKDWTDEFAEFFTKEALGENGRQREYSPDDLVILNTINNAKGERLEPEQIRAKLAAEDLDVNLPPEATAIQGDKAMAVYNEIRHLKAQAANAVAEAERLRTELENEKTLNRKTQQELNEKLIAANREAAAWQARYEMLKEQDNEK